MGKRVKVVIGILVALVGLTTVQYYHDKSRALYRNNYVTLKSASLLRINESEEAASFYKTSHHTNKVNAEYFAKHTMFHYGNLFKKVSDIDSFSERDNEYLLRPQVFLDTGISFWYLTDPMYRQTIYNMENDIALNPATSLTDMYAFMKNISNHPWLYGERYSDGQYQNQSSYLEDGGDILKQYIDDKAYNEEFSRATNIEKDDPIDESSSSSSAVSSEAKKLTKKQKAIDESFQQVLLTISDKITSEEGTPYHAGAQSYPKLPSEYKKLPKTFKVTFTGTQASASAGENVDEKKVFTVKLELDKEDNSFMIVNSKELPSYFSDLSE